MGDGHSKRDTNFNPGDRVYWVGAPDIQGTVEEVISDPDPANLRVKVKWDDHLTTSPWVAQLRRIEPSRLFSPASAPVEPWMDFGLIHQFAFPYPGGLYLGFQVWSADQPVVAELGFTRGVVGGSVFRPATPDEIRMGKAAGWEILPKWTWLIPQLRYRIFIGADLIKELLLMWTMGWEPSETVQQALAQASREGWDEKVREDRVKKVIKAEVKEGKGWPGGGMVN